MELVNLMRRFFERRSFERGDLESAAFKRRLGRVLCLLALIAASAITAPTAHAQAGEEVPFITTPDHVTRVMLELAGVSEKDFVIDLGSGDGRIVITAAKTFGARGLGVEIDPALVERSNANARKAGVADRAEFREQDLFKTDLSAASVITMYLLPEVNLQLRPLILDLKPGTRIVSHDWDMGDWQPDRSRVVAVPDKQVGLEKFSRIHLWTVPAKVQGHWCGQGAHHGWQAQFSQQFQTMTGQFTAGTAPMQTPRPPPAAARAITGRLLGSKLFSSDGFGAVVERAGGPGRPAQFEVTSASGDWAGLAGARFVAAGAAGCPA